MKNLRGTYVHRGDAYRRRRRLQRSVLALSFFGAVAFVIGNRKPAAPTAFAAPVNSSTGFHINVATNKSLTFALDSTRGELDLVRAQLERATTVINYSTKYGINADLASKIVDVASAEGIDPELAFRLVKLQSDFN